MNRTAFVNGGAGGLGTAIGEALAKDVTLPNGEVRSVRAGEMLICRDLDSPGDVARLPQATRHDRGLDPTTGQGWVRIGRAVMLQDR